MRPGRHEENHARLRDDALTKSAVRGSGRPFGTQRKRHARVGASQSSGVASPRTGASRQ